MKKQPLKIYIASRFADRPRLRKYADKIWLMGHHVTASWLGEVRKAPGMTREEFWRKLASKDLQEISQSDILIRCLHNISHTGGADTEFGFALGRHQNIKLWIISPRGARNVFHTLADRIFPSWDACLKELRKQG